jgi:acyl-coenzyme A thioesterase PaaI-like protein
MRRAMLKRLKDLAKPTSLLPLWGYLKNVPGGGAVMGRLVGNMAPYTGTIRPEVIELTQGFAKVRMADRRGVRNHLQSVHAIALMNLGEMSTGLAMTASMPADARGIITHLGMDYLKKARGPITCECSCPLVSSTERKEYDVTADLKSEAGEVVAKITARWMVGPSR